MFMKTAMNERGYLLVEVLLAAIILSIGIIALLGAISKSLDVVRLSRDHLSAVNTLEERLCRLDCELLGYEIPEYEDSVAVESEFRIETTPLGGDGMLREVRFSVIWDEDGGRSAVSLSSLVPEDLMEGQ